MAADIGLIGLAVMGENLALNMESKGFEVAVFNRTVSRVDDFIAGAANGKNITGAHSIPEFIDKLDTPRKIILMVKAGEPVDAFIELLVPHLSKGDLIIDGGNSNFNDTIRRHETLAEQDILFIGTGISGGEEGALKGPAMMPGGSDEAYTLVEPIFTKIAAQVEGTPCCSYIGPNGAGHYVKMVHNGIEYGDMQLICEAYSLMKSVLGMNADEMHEVFSEWNQGELNSYLIEITADIFTQRDANGTPFVDVVLDQAGQKGTGKWTSISALDLGISAPTIAEAVFARCISAIKSERVDASEVIKGPVGTYDGDREAALQAIHDALYAAKICSYAQGFALMREASVENKWNLDLGKIALGWRGGCIIRAKFLHRIAEAFERNPDLPNLLLDSYFRGVIEAAQPHWRNVISTATQLGVPIPAFSSALAYFDSYRSSRLSANLIQAMRDYFGAHTYHKLDADGNTVVGENGEPTVFHTEWMLKNRPEVIVD
ncbi:MAG: decarboxylating NADP(+)-dependent phosphogluconate dehydrogenase [Candidatus Poribacteria bacterium]|nr:decarboxylating NADP(+)-dependent phosphogluconate dehydrogenase [Candidatus Poribacteria bacterium]